MLMTEAPRSIYRFRRCSINDHVGARPRPRPNRLYIATTACDHSCAPRRARRALQI